MTAHKRSNGSTTRVIQPRLAFTLVELLVVIAIISILASLLMPTLLSALNEAKRATCASQIRQLATGMIYYANDYDDFLPRRDGNYGGVWGDGAWDVFTRGYVEADPQIGICPAKENPTRATAGPGQPRGNWFFLGNEPRWRTSKWTSYNFAGGSFSFDRYNDESYATRYYWVKLGAHDPKQTLMCDMVSFEDNSYRRTWLELTESNHWEGWYVKGGNALYPDMSLTWYGGGPVVTLDDRTHRIMEWWTPCLSTNCFVPYGEAMANRSGMKDYYRSGESATHWYYFTDKECFSPKRGRVTTSL